MTSDIRTERGRNDSAFYKNPQYLPIARHFAGTHELGTNVLVIIIPGTVSHLWRFPFLLLPPSVWLWLSVTALTVKVGGADGGGRKIRLMERGERQKIYIPPKGRVEEKAQKKRGRGITDFHKTRERRRGEGEKKSRPVEFWSQQQLFWTIGRIEGGALRNAKSRFTSFILCQKLSLKESNNNVIIGEEGILLCILPPVPMSPRP